MKEVLQGDGAFCHTGIVSASSLASFLENQHFLELCQNEKDRSYLNILRFGDIHRSDVALITRICDWILKQRNTAWLKDVDIAEAAVDDFRRSLREFLMNELKDHNGIFVKALKVKIRKTLNVFV
ncbi:hypothetical protein PtrSN002B_007677 [Pyrenophora tritici-repentis]|uniref:Uncharacterized protein n=1 Tax=Pyrenophora tritici-repentis TaxID=45151 RepID=A0A2W1D6T4_9PLEO|nr:hypothetical protein PtrV1_12678 [Pyrenophora tritici-repentis]KAF7445490.1 hypothetical protein A1F99_104760 [Pyrenophora tritici-repentis]KAF7565772.1 hypothetical protein PtrM4_052060 [Pyrenophora tritici-repentis]KAG9380129.1 hypothetical protein A1F94_009024 [Pyrenophora tritici-repentis]KAI0570674.1 hypothetical protein Alg215_10906 [Pyrenophora tritici-repentis]